GALRPPSENPAFRDQSFVVSAVLASVDAIQDLFVFRRHFGEKPYVVNARSPSFAAPAQITPEEAGELKQTLDQHRARHHWIFTEMVIKHPSHRRQIFSRDCVATPEFSPLGAYLNNLIECEQRRARQLRGAFA